jgi:hypothetical protein
MEPDSVDSDSSSSDQQKSSVEAGHSLKEHDKDKRRRIQDTSVEESHHSHLFRVIHEDLRTKSTVGWQNAVTSFENAYNHLDDANTQEFLQLCFRQIVGIMLDQQYVVFSCDLPRSYNMNFRVRYDPSYFEFSLSCVCHIVRAKSAPLKKTVSFKH